VRVVGLTGGIGSGKSEVARMFTALGAHLIDADQLAREVVEPGSRGLAEIVEAFGPDVLDRDGRLDRKKVAAIVFKDPDKRAVLERIVHPRVLEAAMARIATLAERGAKVVVYDVPLLYETGLDRHFPEVIVVDVDPATQRARLAGRGGMSADEIEDRIRAQMALADKVKRAHWVIDNRGSLDETRAQVEALYRALERDA
jgi:dephospho-CoA kinase